MTSAEVATICPEFLGVSYNSIYNDLVIRGPPCNYCFFLKCTKRSGEDSLENAFFSLKNHSADFVENMTSSISSAVYPKTFRASSVSQIFFRRFSTQGMILYYGLWAKEVFHLVSLWSWGPNHSTFLFGVRVVRKPMEFRILGILAHRT